jgi:Fe-S-cluster-containing hydrogenase component 2
MEMHSAGKPIVLKGQCVGCGACEKICAHEGITVTDKKAATIFVRISSCYGDGAVTVKKKFSLGEEEVTAHADCFLKIDDIELVY